MENEVKTVTITQSLTIAFRKKDGNSSKRDKRRSSYFLKPRIFIFPASESIIDNLMNRHDRPHKAWETNLIPIIFKALGIPEMTKVRWSQKAGCTCPCSPGFIIEDHQYPHDIFVDIKSSVEGIDTPEPETPQLSAGDSNEQPEQHDGGTNDSSAVGGESIPSNDGSEVRSSI